MLKGLYKGALDNCLGRNGLHQGKSAMSAREERNYRRKGLEESSMGALLKRDTRQVRHRACYCCCIWIHAIRIGSRTSEVRCKIFVFDKDK